jgi:hypothetical protein
MRVDSVGEVMEQLRAMPPHAVARLQLMGNSVRSFFQYTHRTAADRTAGLGLAPDLIMQAICRGVAERAAQTT